MPHRTLIVLSVILSLGASIFVADQIQSHHIGSGLLTLLWIGLVPVRLAEFAVPSLIFTGGVLVFLLVLGRRAWRDRSAVRTLTFCFLMLATTTIANVHTYVWHKNRYPYGSSHCCLKGVGLSLSLYAGDHDGRLPAGGATPEASLSLLLTNYCDLNTLKGKAVKLEAAAAAFGRNGVLDPDTCSWHYVEGLTEGDNPEIAVVWDKVPGLGHNGERLRSGSTAVLFLDGHEDYVPAPNWAAFLKRQGELLAARPQRLKQGLPAILFKIRLPSGELVDRYEGAFKFRCAGYTVAGTNLTTETLRWNKISISQGTLSPSLTLPGMRSKPVDITVSNFWPSSNEVAIEMEKTN